MKTKKQTLLKVLYFLSLLAFAYGVISVFRHNFLPLRYRFYGIGAVVFIYIIMGILLFARKNNHLLLKALMALIFLVVGGVSLVGAYSLNKGIDVLDRLNQSDKRLVEFSLVVKKDSDITETEDLKDEKVLTALSKDLANIVHFKDHFNQTKSYELEFEDGDNYNSVAKKLLDDETKAILLNESFRSIIEDAKGTEDFSSKTRVLERFTVEIEIDPEKEAELTAEAKAELDKISKQAAEKYGQKDGESTLGGFALYISGIDSYGDISTSGRSDVNIVASVNPKTRKVIIASIPRDTYVPIAGGGYDNYDKLTHAGIYGIESSKATVQNLLEMPIEYYARVNFSSLIEMVDVLGGIYVDNPVSFSSMGFDFPQGNIYLSGKQALAFSRERYSLAEGDFDRGRNQMRVIEGIIRKSLSPAILLNYQDVLDTVLRSSQTNMPSSKIIELVNNQIDNGGEWQFENLSVKGYGQMGLPSYAMPGWDLYMFVPDQESVDDIARQLYLNLQ
ncbi:MAG: LCP family protein [Tissierellia bacterium]|nr:LCP family protein [Tissierellia bacterium]